MRLKLCVISVLWPIEVLVKGPYNIDNGSSEHSARGHKPNPPVIGVAATSRLGIFLVLSKERTFSFLQP